MNQATNRNRSCAVQTTRLIYLNLIILVGLLEKLIEYFRPQENAGNWAGAVVGAFIIRLVLPKIPFWTSFSGFFAATCFALLFSGTIARNTHFAGWDSFAVYAFVALVGDALLQLLAFVIRLARKLTDYTLDHPADAFDGAVDRAEKVVTVWVKLKTAVLELLAQKP